MQQEEAERQRQAEEHQLRLQHAQDTVVEWLCLQMGGKGVSSNFQHYGRSGLPQAGDTLPCWSDVLAVRNCVNRSLPAKNRPTRTGQSGQSPGSDLIEHVSRKKAAYVACPGDERVFERALITKLG